jgi:hypothetical protein
MGDDDRQIVQHRRLARRRAFERINDALVTEIANGSGATPTPRRAIIDSQSVKTTQARAPVTNREQAARAPRPPADEMITMLVVGAIVNCAGADAPPAFALVMTTVAGRGSPASSTV